jgi:hypothetical protein
MISQEWRVRFECGMVGRDYYVEVQRFAASYWATIQATTPVLANLSPEDVWRVVLSGIRQSGTWTGSEFEEVFYELAHAYKNFTILPGTRMS